MSLIFKVNLSFGLVSLISGSFGFVFDFSDFLKVHITHCNQVEISLV